MRKRSLPRHTCDDCITHCFTHGITHSLHYSRHYLLYYSFHYLLHYGITRALSVFLCKKSSSFTSSGQLMYSIVSGSCFLYEKRRHYVALMCEACINAYSCVCKRFPLAHTDLLSYFLFHPRGHRTFFFFFTDEATVLFFSFS